MLDKYIQLGGGDAWGPDYVPIHQHTLTKIASSCYTPTSLMDVMGKLVPRPEGRYVLLNALGAHEYWGCFTAGTLISSEYGDVPIETLKPGDNVLTHKGRYRPIVNTQVYGNKRTKLIIKVEGLSDSIHVTPEHPFLVMTSDLTCRRDKYKRCTTISQGEQSICKRYAGCAVADEKLEFIREWRNAGELVKGDFLAIPKDVFIEKARMTEAEANLFGLFLAEGNFEKYTKTKEKVGIRLSFNENETPTLVANAVKCAESLGLEGRVYHHKSGTQVCVVIKSRELAAKFYSWSGEYAAHKQMPRWLFNQPINIQHAVLAGLFDGDAHYNKTTDVVVLRLASKQLILDVQRMLRNWGIASCYQANNWSKEHPDILYHQVSFPTWKLPDLTKYSSSKYYKTTPQHKKTRSFGDDEYFYVPIRNIEKYESDDLVYNFEVEEDHSYIAGGVAVHNCNMNGDAFPEWSLKGDQPPKSVQDIVELKVKPKIPDFVIPHGNYGHSTFVSNAKVYVGHANTDPTRSIGDVIASAYNDKMHRVELIVFVYTDRNPELVQKIDANEPVPFSMGAKLRFDVCLLPGALVATPNGPKTIESLTAGDLVFTQQGNTQEVIQTFVTPGIHNVRKIKIGGIGDDLQITDNHPVYVLKAEHVRGCAGTVGRGMVRRHSFSGNVCKKCGITADELAGKAAFIRADDIDVGDYVLSPAVASSANEAIDESLAYVAGLYLGDGSLIFSTSKRHGRRAVGVSICCQDDLIYVEHVKQALTKVSDSPVNVYAAGSDRKAWVVQTHDNALAAYLHGACGVKKSKKIPAQIWASGLEARKALLAGLVDSDGSVDPRRLTTRFSNTLPALIQGVQLLATSCGYASTYHWRTFTQSTYSGEGVYATVSLGTAFTADTKELSFKCGKHTTVPRWSNKVLQLPRQNWFPVETIEEGVYEGDVYNIAVEADETYLVNNVAVHNCSICLNIARTRAEYCEHLSAMLRQTLPDGRRVYSYNFFPRFFDISYVRVPADRSAWALKKVAALPQALIPTHRLTDKLAELVKKELGSGETLGSTPVNPKLVRLMTSRVVDDYSERPEDPEILRLIARCKIEKALASLTAMGVILKPQEVVKLSSRYPALFSRSFSLNDIDPMIVRAADDIVKRTTTHNPYLMKRAEARSVVKGPLDTDSAAFTQYREYLKSIDFNKLAAWLTTSPVAQLTLQMDNFLYKVAGIDTQQTGIPLCLPTACLVYYLNSTN